MVFNPHQGMVISTPPINSTTDCNTITMNNTLLNAAITAPFSPPSGQKSLSSSSTSSFASTATSTNQTGPLDPVPNTAQPSSPSSSSASRQRRASTNPDGYVARVGFDTLGGNDTSDYAFTLQSKTDNWKRTKKSRTFLIGIDLNDYSAHALHWVMENMVEDGDEVVALRVMPVELRDSLSKTGIPSFHGQESAARSEATKIMNSIREKNTDREISIVVEYMVGNVRDTIQHMIKLYEPDMLVVGTRGRSSVKGFLLGSVSRYCLHHSSVPVIVVRPQRKLNKSKTKAKGIFRRRSSVMIEDNQGYQPHPTQPIHMSTSDFDLQSSSSINLSNNTLSTPGIALFPSATISGGEKYPSNAHKMRPNSSSFFSGSPSPSPASSISSITLPPIIHSRSPAPPPPEGVIKMKKSVTTDGTGKGSKSFGKSSGGFLSGSLLLGPLIGSSRDKDKDKDKDGSGGGGGSSIGGFLKGKKRHSHGG